MTATHGEKPHYTSNFAQSLLLIAAFVALALSVSIVVSLILIDFVHGNPNRSKGNALTMMFLFPPLLSLIAVIGVFLVFSASQIVQAHTMRFFYVRHGRYAYALAILLVPLLAVLTWYCYDYLTPTNFNLAINAGADWVPYKHGITTKRYVAALIAQGAVSGFSLLNFYLNMSGTHRRKFFIASIALAVVVGAIVGWQLAMNQYQFLPPQG